METFFSVLSAVSIIIAIGSGALVGLQRGRFADIKMQLDESRAETRSVRDTLNEERAERERERAERERERTRVAQERADDHAKLAAMGGEIDYLKSIATGQVHWESLSMQVEELTKAFRELAREMRTHNRAAMTHWKSELEALAKLALRGDGS